MLSVGYLAYSSAKMHTHIFGIMIAFQVTLYNFHFPTCSGDFSLNIWRKTESNQKLSPPSCNIVYDRAQQLSMVEAQYCRKT